MRSQTRSQSVAGRARTGQHASTASARRTGADGERRRAVAAEPRLAAAARRRAPARLRRRVRRHELPSRLPLRTRNPLSTPVGQGCEFILYPYRLIELLVLPNTYLHVQKVSYKDN